MTSPPDTSPVEDTVPKTDGDIAVGENLAFQRKWWVFERLIWGFFLFLIVCDLLGVFGEGWLSKARASVPDGSLSVDYERIERASTPSTMTFHFGPGAIQGGRVRLYVSDSVVKALGAERVAPQPEVSAVGGNGISYTFPATTAPAEVEIQLQPSSVGSHAFRVQTPNEPPIDGHVFVVP